MIPTACIHRPTVSDPHQHNNQLSLQDWDGEADLTSALQQGIPCSLVVHYDQVA